MSLLSPTLRAVMLITVLAGSAFYVCPAKTSGRASPPASSTQRGRELKTKRPAENVRRPAKPVAELPAKEKRWALVIGVDVYVTEDIGNLSGASNDAEYLAKSLVQYAGFPQDNVIVLNSRQHPSKQPTRNNIIKYLTNLRANVPRDGLLLVSFSGHGIGQDNAAFLLPSDAGTTKDIEMLKRTALSVGDIKELISQTGVKQVIFIIDSCRNDPANSKGIGDNLMTAAFSRSFNFSLRNDDVTAFAILYAAAVGQRAYVYAEKGQGYFTWALIEGIKGGAANAMGEVTLQNLIRYLEARVPKLVRRDLGHSAIQIPYSLVAGYMASELVVSYVKRPAVGTEDTEEEGETPLGFEEVVTGVLHGPPGAIRLAAHTKSVDISPGQSAQISFVLTNAGAKEEQFRVETDLPTDYQPNFGAVQGAPAGGPVLVTPKLKRGASINLLLNVRAPEASIDGQQRRFYVTAAPPSQPDAMTAALATLAVKSPPALAVVSGVSTQTVQSGEEVIQTIIVSNAGGASARDARVEFILQSGFEYVNAEPRPQQYDRGKRTLIWHLGDLEGRTERKIVLTARAWTDAPASSAALGSGVLRADGTQPAVPFVGANVVVERAAREMAPDFKHVPDLRLALRRSSLAAQPGQTIRLPLIITNAGNKEDQFRLETNLPAEYQPTFSQGDTDAGLPILVTPQMQRGSSVEVILNARVPENAPDNQQQRFTVRAASLADTTMTKVTDATLTVVAAALMASSNVTQESVMPGDTFTQRISVRNVGSAVARQTRADFVFDLDFELVNATPAPISYDRPSRTAAWSLGELESRESREITVTLRAIPDAVAGAGKLVGRGTMRTSSLSVPSNFDGPTINVGRVARARVDAVSKGLTATPGDTMFLPFVVRNPGNYSENFELRVVAPGAPQAAVYADLNGDGLHQAGEPTITQISALAPRGGEYNVLLRVDVPRTTPDRTQFAYNLVARATSTARVAAEDSALITVAAPRVRVRFELVSIRHASFVSPAGSVLIGPVNWQKGDKPPKEEQDIFNRGSALFAKGQYEQAAAVFRDFLKEYPNSFITDLILLWLGRCYIELGKLTEAEQVLQRMRTIKDTPFIDIYEAELQNAKTAAPSRPAAPQSSRESPMGSARPGDWISYRLVLVNDGGGRAKSLSLAEYLPDALEFVSSSPELSLQDMPGGGRGLVWRVEELAPGDTAVLQVTVRLRQNLAAGVELSPRHSLVYQDTNANSYRGQ